MNKRQSRSPFLFIGGAFALVLLGIWLYRVMVREETLAEAALRCANYLESGDAAGLMRYIREDEKSLLNLDTGKVQAFLDHLYSSRMAGFRRVGEDTLQQYVGMNGLGLMRTYRHDDGREAILDLTVVATDTHPKLNSFSSTVVSTAMMTYWPKEKHLRPPAVSGAVAKLAAFEEAIGLLESLPVPGFTTVSRDEVRVITWREALDGFKARAEKLKTLSDGPQVTPGPQTGTERIGAGAPILPGHR